MWSAAPRLARGETAGDAAGPVPQGEIILLRHKLFMDGVIPGRVCAAGNPESTQAPVVMGSGFAASRRPGTTHSHY